MRSAIIGSYNRAAAHTLMTKVGVETAAQYLLNMGVDEDHINNNLTGAGLGPYVLEPLQIQASILSQFLFQK